jgi:hypothetical protein
LNQSKRFNVIEFNELGMMFTPLFGIMLWRPAALPKCLALGAVRERGGRARCVRRGEH